MEELLKLEDLKSGTAYIVYYGGRPHFMSIYRESIKTPSYINIKEEPYYQPAREGYSCFLKRHRFEEVTFEESMWVRDCLDAGKIVRPRSKFLPIEEEFKQY